jgi:aryl-alcohol dehydrogenase-like predicted oxidoreductase
VINLEPDPRDYNKVSLAWVMEKGAVPLVGASTPEQVDAAADAVDLVLSGDEVAELDNVALARESAAPWYRRFLQE